MALLEASQGTGLMTCVALLWGIFGPPFSIRIA